MHFTEPADHCGSDKGLGLAGNSDRAAVNTFDVFDTLIARRCIDATRIFEMMETRTGLGHFAAARQQAEASVAHRPYDLDAIYVALSLALGLSDEQADLLKGLELALERENVIPIEEHLHRVADGDVLVSDMYLGADMIRSLLDSAGLSKKISLIVSSDGKQSGRIWPLLNTKFNIQQHTGDNIYSDNIVPKSFGVATCHTVIHRPNVVEQTFIDVGLRDLAQICREIRLATWVDDPAFRTLQIVQADFNFPLMILASIALLRLTRDRDRGSILFSSRDCNLWLSVFEVVAGHLGRVAPCEYFYTSRVTRTRPSAEYMAYARDKLRDGALVVDLCGTGWSLSHLFQKLDLHDMDVFFLQKLSPVKLYEDLSPTPASCTIRSIVECDDGRYDHEILEMCNYARHGMVLDVRQIGSTDCPVFSRDRRPDHLERALILQQQVFSKGVEKLAKISLNETYKIDDKSLVTLFEALYAGLSQQKTVLDVYKAQHFSEDIRTLAVLGCL